MVRLNDEARNGLPEGFPRPRIISGVGSGWWPIVEDTHRRLLEIDPGYTVDQVKEKFGGLRYYFTASDGPSDHYDVMEAIVDEAERKSMTVCEWCGEPAPAGPRGKAGTSWSWRLTLCDKHQRERDFGTRS